MDTLIHLLKLKKYRAAELLLREALNGAPEDTYTLTQLANVLWNRHKDKEALYYADKAEEVLRVISQKRKLSCSTKY